MKQEIKQLAQDLLGIRKQEFRIKTALASLGVEEAAMPALLDLMGAVYEIGWDDHSQSQPRTSKTPPVSAAQEAFPKKHVSLREALLRVMNRKAMNISMILEQLENRGWAPNSKRPRKYIATALSGNNTLFEHVEGKGSGWYRLREVPQEVPSQKTKQGQSRETRDKPELSQIQQLIRKRTKPFLMSEIAVRLGVPTADLHGMFSFLRDERWIEVRGQAKNGAYLWQRVGAVSLENPSELEDLLLKTVCKAKKPLTGAEVTLHAGFHTHQSGQILKALNTLKGKGKLVQVGTSPVCWKAKG